MSELLDLLKEARERCGMAWSDDDPDDIAGRIDHFLAEGENEAIQHVAYQPRDEGMRGQFVFYHDKGISVFDIYVGTGVTLVPHDTASARSMKDLVRDLHWRSENR